MKKTTAILLFYITGFILNGSASLAQDSVRTLPAMRATTAIKLDGLLNEDAWKAASPANGFVEQRPVYMRAEDPATRTEFFITYDDNAVYFAGYCHERSKDSISTELVGRDRIGVNDDAGVIFDTYHDKINGVGFFVTPLGEQYDAKYSLGYEDGSWNSVYETATKIHADGWSFEMRIPYSALRFSTNKLQTWGINFIRKRAKSGKQYTWSPIDPNKFGLMNQSGTWNGISDIKSPIRLSFSPYFSSYLTRTPSSLRGNNKWESSFNGGMDVKYGISKGFTLDMTLIPDFGQVQSDNLVLNLSPFEVRYNENRAFFTEGTELFNKGNLFYSRRIGGRPLRSVNYDPAIDSLVEEPGETKLINATKISGRTAKGLGVGFFNAVIKPQHARLENKTTHEIRKYETNPLTNYNILVLDQTMKNNSSVTLVNTSVLRNGKDYDATVTAFLFDLYDNQVAWNVWGKFANSRLYNKTPNETTSGVNYEANIGRFKGPLNFEVHQYMADEKYQQNDMGYFTNNNFMTNGFGAWYKVNKPKRFYNNMFFQLRGNYSELYKPRRYQYTALFWNANMQLKSLWSVGANGNLYSEEHDFYESRTGNMFRRPASVTYGAFLNSNSAKKYALGVEYSDRVSGKYHSSSKSIYLSNRYRFNDKLSVSLDASTDFSKGVPGFAGIDTLGSGTSYFGLRQIRSVENILNIKYNFNIKMGVNFRMRHYWSKVYYDKFYSLQEDGYLAEKTGMPTISNPDYNVNFFNIDMVYTWQFALGSFINIGWKTAGLVENANIRDKYFHNLDQTLKSAQQNTFSIKVIYYLDYLDIKKKLHKKGL